MKFKAEDFKNLQYPVLDIPKNSTVLETYPELVVYPEFNYMYEQFGIKTDTIHRYVFLMYQESPLSTLPTISERKKEAGLLAGFEYRIRGKNRKASFSTAVEKIMIGQNQRVNGLIIRVCRMLRKQYYLDRVLFEEALDKQRAKLQTDDDNVYHVKNTIANIELLVEKIEQINKIILQEDSSADLISSLYDYVEADMLGVEPESVAVAKKNDRLEDLIPNPYEQI